jgi:hypothetical protein
MVSAVWKFDIPLQDTFTIDMPSGGQIRAVGVQAHGPVLWATVQPDGEMVARNFRLVGTGHPFVLDGLEHVGTFQLRTLGGSEFVGHLFEEVSGG